MSLAAGETATPRRQRDAYQPTNASTKLFFLPGPKMQVRTFIPAGERRYELCGAFVVDFEFLPDNTVFASHRSLPVHGYGESVERALDEFFAAFDMQWRNLIEVAESTLTPGALDSRAALRSVVASVGHAAGHRHGEP